MSVTSDPTSEHHSRQRMQGSTSGGQARASTPSVYGPTAGAPLHPALAAQHAAAATSYRSRRKKKKSSRRNPWGPKRNEGARREVSAPTYAAPPGLHSSPASAAGVAHVAHTPAHTATHTPPAHTTHANTHPHARAPTHAAPAAPARVPVDMETYSQRLDAMANPRKGRLARLRDKMKRMLVRGKGEHKGYDGAGNDAADIELKGEVERAHTRGYLMPYLTSLTELAARTAAQEGASGSAERRARVAAAYAERRGFLPQSVAAQVLAGLDAHGRQLPAAGVGSRAASSVPTCSTYGSRYAPAVPVTVAPADEGAHTQKPGASPAPGVTAARPTGAGPSALSLGYTDSEGDDTDDDSDSRTDTSSDVDSDANLQWGSGSARPSGFGGSAIGGRTIATELSSDSDDSSSATDSDESGQVFRPLPRRARKAGAADGPRGGHPTIDLDITTDESGCTSSDDSDSGVSVSSSLDGVRVPLPRRT